MVNSSANEHLLTDHADKLDEDDCPLKYCWWRCGWRWCPDTSVVNSTSPVFEHEHVDESTLGDVVAGSVRPLTADISATRRRLCDVTFPRPRTAALSDVGFELEPTRLGGRAVHIDVQQPVMFTVPSITTNSIL